MSHKTLGVNVFDAALQRLEALYAGGHRLILSLSGGKDSTVCLELMVIAAKKTGRLPVECVYQDEEAVYPSTREFMENVIKRSDVKLHWFVREQYCLLNVYSRTMPYYRPFDQIVGSNGWVMPLHKKAQLVGKGTAEQNIHYDRFPVEDIDKHDLIMVVGIRAQESGRRNLMISSIKGHLTGHNSWGLRKCFPIYDWTDAHVWLAIKKFGWDYNKAYDLMYRAGVPAKDLRVGPPSLSVSSLPVLKLTRQLWPEWYTRMCARLPGIREAVVYGKRYLQPGLNSGENWQQCFDRVCVREAPQWIAERAIEARNAVLRRHSAHSTLPLPDSRSCPGCPSTSGPASWQTLTKVMWNGDPIGMHTSRLGVKAVDVGEFFPDMKGSSQEKTLEKEA